MQELPSQKPLVSDFKHDMNGHGNARYARRVAGGSVYVLELERFGPGRHRDGSFTLTVWRAVEQPDEAGRWATPDVRDNSYAWDAVGRETYEDAEDETGDAQGDFRRLKDRGVAVSKWCSEHPYDGPRRTWAERHGYDD